jgi:Spy/CpxP family protein refolding chaperone
MNKQKRGLPALALGIVLILSVSAGAWTMAQHQRQRHGEGDHGMMLRHILGELDLTEEQTEAVHEGMLAHHEALGSAVETLREARDAVAQAIHAPEFDEAAIREASAEAGLLEADLAVGRGEMLRELRGILTPDQQEKLETMLGTILMEHGVHGRGHGPKGAAHGRGDLPRAQPQG